MKQLCIVHVLNCSLRFLLLHDYQIQIEILFSLVSQAIHHQTSPYLASFYLYKIHYFFLYYWVNPRASIFLIAKSYIPKNLYLSLIVVANTSKGLDTDTAAFMPWSWWWSPKYLSKWLAPNENPIPYISISSPYL